MTIVTVIVAGLLIVAIVLATVSAVIAVAVVCASHKRILLAHKKNSFADSGEAPLHYMSFFDKQILFFSGKKSKKETKLEAISKP